MWIAYTGKVAPITQEMRQCIKMMTLLKYLDRFGNRTDTFLDLSNTWDDYIRILFWGFVLLIIIYYLCLPHYFLLKIQILINVNEIWHHSFKKTSGMNINKDTDLILNTWCLIGFRYLLTLPGPHGYIGYEGWHMPIFFLCQQVGGSNLKPCNLYLYTH